MLSPTQVFVDESERREYPLCGRSSSAAMSAASGSPSAPCASPAIAGCMVPYAIAWAVGRGGDWRRRAEPLLDKVSELGP